MPSAIALAILLGGLWLMAGRLRIAWRSPHWPTTAGSVVDASPVQSGTTDSDEPVYNAKVVFRYVVAGRAYEADTIEALPWLMSGDQVERKLQAYPPGRAVLVHYDPANPAVAVLIPGMSRLTKFFLLLYLGVCGLLIGQLLGLVETWSG